MCRTIYFADKILLFSSRPVGEPYHEIPLEAGTTLPQAKILNFLETFNFVAVVTPDPDRCFAAFAAAFRLVEAAGGAVVNDRGERLMIYRNGRWDLPKGHWERGETIGRRGFDPTSPVRHAPLLPVTRGVGDETHPLVRDGSRGRRDAPAADRRGDRPRMLVYA